MNDSSKSSRKNLMGGLSWALLPATIFYFIFMLAPLAVVIYYSIQPNPLITEEIEGFTWKNYAYFFTQRYYADTVLRTLKFSLISAIISVVVGYTTALVIQKYSNKIGSTAILALSFPILAGPIVTVMGWMIMLTSTGAIGQSVAFFRTLLGYEVATKRLLGTDVAVIIGMVHFNLAFVVLNILNVLEKIEPSLQEAAMNLGANRWKTFWSVVWPMSLPGVLSASLISFALSMNSFVTPLYLGNTSRPVLTTLISQFMLSTYNWQMASATSVILLVISLVIIVSYNHVVNRSIKI